MPHRSKTQYSSSRYHTFEIICFCGPGGWMESCVYYRPRHGAPPKKPRLTKAYSLGVGSLKWCSVIGRPLFFFLNQKKPTYTRIHTYKDTDTYTPRHTHTCTHTTYHHHNHHCHQHHNHHHITSHNTQPYRNARNKNKTIREQKTNSPPVGSYKVSTVSLASRHVSHEARYSCPTPPSPNRFR